MITVVIKEPAKSDIRLLESIPVGTAFWGIEVSDKTETKHLFVKSRVTYADTVLFRLDPDDSPFSNRWCQGKGHRGFTFFKPVNLKIYVEEEEEKTA